MTRKLKSVQNLQALIENKIPESQTLEYKRPDALENYDKVAKTISYFANSVGGLIIYGIAAETKTKLPQSIIWVDTINWSQERIENVVLSRLPKLEEIDIRKIINPNDSSKAIFLVEVPESVTAPHMAPDGRYHRRVGSRSIIMPDDMVRDMMFRRQKPFLSLELRFLTVNIEDFTFKLGFLLRNIGRAIAKYTRLTASFNNLDIIESSRYFKRIDSLRGLPSIQYDNVAGVFHPSKDRRTSIGEVTLKVKDNEKVVTIVYDLVAEDMNFKTDKYSFDLALLRKTKERLEKGEHQVLIHRK